jgi:CBS domain-containing protein
VIEERVRASLGRVCSHPSALDVEAEGGRVTLTGPILEHEYERVIRAALGVRGVRRIESFLERHIHPERVPGLRPSPPTHQSPRLRCADVMKTAVQSVRERETLRRAAEKMALANVGFLPVCDEERRVIGTVTDRDIVVRGLASELATDGVRVEQVMTRNAIACAPDDDLSEAERLMAQNQISRLVVTDADGRLLGVISLSDVAMRERGPALVRTFRAVVAREAPAPTN